LRKTLFGLKRDEVRGNGENYMLRNLVFCTFTQYCASDRKDKNVIVEACSAYGGVAYTGLWWGNLGERDQWREPGVDWRIILRRIFSK